jgi:hypothetical protein
MPKVASLLLLAPQWHLKPEAPETSRCWDEWSLLAERRQLGNARVVWRPTRTGTVRGVNAAFVRRYCPTFYCAWSSTCLLNSLSRSGSACPHWMRSQTIEYLFKVYLVAPRHS